MLFRLLVLVLSGSCLANAAVFGNLRGIVHDPDHRPIPQAHVTVRAARSEWRQEVQTDDRGAFEIAAVPAGEYTVTAEHPGFAPLLENVTVTSGSAPILHFPLQLATAVSTVETSASPEAVDAQAAGVSSMISRKQIERAPGADRTNSLAFITDFVPGAYMTHDQLHVRGGHQVTWAVDGVPVPNTNIASNVGPQFDPKDIDYLEVQRGGYSAEYGDRTYAVFNVVPRTGFEREREGELVTSYGSFHQNNSQLSFGDHSTNFAWYGGVNGNRTDLGLETPVPAVLHDQASGLGAFGTLIYNLDPNNQLRLVSSVRRDYYQIPNDPEQQAAGLRDAEREHDEWVNLSWVRAAQHGVLLTVSPFFHQNGTHYLGSAEDRQTSRYSGAQVSLAKVDGRHNAKLGLYAFLQRDDRLFEVSGLRQQQNLDGRLAAVFLEDQFRAASWLTLTGGVRLTHFDGGLSENAASPRAGAAIRIPRLQWVLRGFYGRYYQAPPLSTVSGPALEAAGQGFGFLALRGERDEERQFGLSIPLRGWAVEADQFLTKARNYFDHEALGNSNVFFPLTIAGARLEGWEVTLRSPRLARRGQLHLAYARLRAEGEGAVSGGLTDFAPPPEGRFLLDHDQRHTLNVGFVADLPCKIWASANVYYGSGFAEEGGPGHLAGHTTFDAMLGRNFGKSLTISVSALNAANRRYLLDNSATFGGTHYADPRQVFAQVRYRFKLDH